MRNRGRNDAASMAITGFAVAVSIYALAFVAYVSFLQTPAGQHKEGPMLDARAAGGVEEVVGSAGDDWHLSGPDNIKRFGLAPPGKPGALDVDKLRNITKGNMSRNATNGLLDYEEARDAMGLGVGYDFHLRAFPILSSMEEAGIRPIKGLRVAYVGDYVSTPGGSQSNYPVQNSSGFEERGSIVWVNVTVTNNGTTPSMFKVDYTVPAEDDEMEEGDAWTPILAPGDSHTASLKLFKQPSWEWEDNSGMLDTNISVTIRDPTRVVGQLKVNLASVDMTSPDYALDYGAIIVNPEKWSYKTNQFAKVSFMVWKPDGNIESNPTVNITVRNMSSGALVDQYQGRGTGSSKYQLCCTLPAGNYSVVIYRPTDPVFNATETLVITDGSEGSFTSSGVTTITESYASAYERGVLSALVDRWVNSTYDSGSGDVYRDLSYDMNNDLAANLTGYRALVVGSNVDQNAMTDIAAREAVKNFVAGGGLLIVFGSQDQDVGWLQPLFDASIVTSGNGVGVPDPQHPILHVPEELAYQRHVDSGRTWSFASDTDAAHFTHVVHRDGGSTYRDAILSVSKPGHFGNGTIVLTSWQLYNLTDPQDEHEALATQYNFLLQALGPLFIDMGPRIPDRAEVASSARMATAPHTWLADEKVLVRVVLYVFR